MKDFSQNGEQKIILDYFGAHVGTFLSCGENDGETLSNVRALALLNWSGVCVEPAPVAFSKLAQLYGGQDRVRLINAAITSQNGPIDFWDCGVHLHKGDTSLLSTTRPEEMARWKRSGEQFTKTTVRGITFETMVRECGVNRFDMISIDAEGADLDILRQIDLTSVGCRLLCIETNGKDNDLFIGYCRNHSMSVIHSNHENIIFSK